jgi:hypothetical protein
MGEKVAKEMLWLAWNACSGPIGMGWMQDCPDAQKDDVWDRANGAGDYGGVSSKRAGPNQVHGDYVYGRMMKITFEYGDEFIEFQESKLSPDYQAWCRKYPTYSDLTNAALNSLKK